MFWNRRSEADHQPEAPSGPGLSENLRALLASFSSYLRARLELAGLEGREAVAVYGSVVAFALGAVLLLLFGYVFFWIGLVASIAYLADIHWSWLMLGAALLHFIGVAVCLALASRFWGQPVFTSTLEEFRKDQQWLSRTTTSPTPTERSL